MKINNMRTIGAGLVNKGMENRYSKAIAERLQLSKKDIVTNGVNVKEVSDKLSLIMAAMTLGETVSESIRLGSNFSSVDFSEFFKDGRTTLGDKAVEVALFSADLYWKCWDKQMKAINTDKAAKIVEERKGMELGKLYEEEDVRLSVNKFNSERYIYVVNNYYVLKTQKMLNSINADTTLNELLTFQADFAQINRGCGESSLDSGKDLDKVLALRMNQLISPALKTVGAVKEFESNIKTYRKDKEDYEITIPGQEDLYKDFIGDLKVASKDVIVSEVNNYISIMDKECHFESYSQYDEIDLLDERVFEIAKMISNAQEIVTREDADEEDRLMLLGAIYNRAKELEIEETDVIKIGIKLAISQIRQYKGKVVASTVINTEKEYLVDLWKVCSLFKDIFVSEYNEQPVIEVPVNDYVCNCDIPMGTEIAICDGIGFYGEEGYDNYIEIYGPYQNGTIRIGDNEVLALYNPLEETLKHYPNAVAVLVDSYSEVPCRFSQWKEASVETIEAEESFGFERAKEADRIDIIEIGDDAYGAAAVKGDTLAAVAKIESNTTVKIVNHKVFKSMIVGELVK